MRVHRLIGWVRVSLANLVVGWLLSGGMVWELDSVESRLRHLVARHHRRGVRLAKAECTLGLKCVLEAQLVLAARLRYTFMPPNQLKENTTMHGLATQGCEGK
eukprot:3517016-Pyramimonas_sp.AAC.1